MCPGGSATQGSKINVPPAAQPPRALKEIYMKTLFIDCSMGVAGDMLTAALAGATGDIKAVEAELNALGIPGV